MMAHEHGVENKQDNGRTERRFNPEPTGRTNLTALLNGIGAAAFGAAVYATWIRDEPLSYGPVLFGVGLSAIITAALLGDTSPALRVGAAGVGIERGGPQPERIAWCDITAITIEDGKRVVVASAADRIVAELDRHAPAAAWILKEAGDRIPKRVKIDPDRAAQLVREIDESAMTVAYEPVQVAGRRCAKCDAVITFEVDAHLCARCGQVYHRDHVPERCMACEADLKTS
jgi:hypothetical protein